MSPDRIRQMLLLEDSYMWLMFASAVAVGFVGLRLLRRARVRSLPHRRARRLAAARPERRHVVGAAIFGVGWAVSDVCPGPVAAQLGQGIGWSVPLLAGIGLGALMFLRRQERPARDHAALPASTRDREPHRAPRCRPVNPAPAIDSPRMNLREAETYLLDLELFGMRFGLDRMHKLMTVLGMPQRRFASIHVVGSNGKSSTTRMIAAILERHGLRTGTYTSPHLRSFAERIEVGERPLDGAAFGAAVERVARAARLVDRTLDEDDRVTQFEALTAAAYSELARRGSRWP